MKVCFLGTPEFALPSLNMLIDTGYDVIGVFTQPDRPKNRGKKLEAPPVKKLALERGVPVYQFERIRSAEGVAKLKELAPDIIVTAAFGQILSKDILDIAPLGCVNVHGSLLPAYRGPAPVQWAVINGESVTGVSIMMTDEGIDTGDVILRRETGILPEETAGELYLRLADLGAEALRDALVMIRNGTAVREKQDGKKATYFRMLKKEDGRIRWDRTAKEVVNQIRGVTPWPGAYFTAGDVTLKAEAARVVEAEGEIGPAGTVAWADGKCGLAVYAADGIVEIGRVQAPGGKMMPSSDYLRGHSIAERLT